MRSRRGFLWASAFAAMTTRAVTVGGWGRSSAAARYPQVFSTNWPAGLGKRAAGKGEGVLGGAHLSARRSSAADCCFWVAPQGCVRPRPRLGHLRSPA